MAATPHSADDKTGNRFLDALPLEARSRLLKDSQFEQLPIRRVLWEPDDEIETVYFPISGVVSLVTLMKDGGHVEMATIGREGIVGVPMVLDGRSITNAQAVSQVVGEAISVSADVFIDEVKAGGAFASLMHNFMQALFTLVGQNAACNRRHTVTQRAARWLLLTQDRVGSDKFGLTHEFLSQMIGSRRASVTEAAGELSDAGAITYRRGVVHILSRDALEASACECYGLIRRAFDKLY
ncbi:MAG: Crp/Fnr family transcriptional regulator [Actinomycetota bacterium]